MSLRIDWATSKAAKYACENWHYTGYLPSASCRIGVWEEGTFKGVVLFGIGAANATRGEKYGLKRKGEVAELVRIALRDHVAPVSRIVAIALKMMKGANPGVRMVVSFADQSQGHHGGIYQAGNWVYSGRSVGDHEFFVRGKIMHPKTLHSMGWRQSEEWLIQHIDPKAKKIKAAGKHRYLMPLDAEMRDRIAPLAKPYPKRPKQATSGVQPDSGGATPTRTLQDTAEEATHAC
jgi:hypothetical protein